MFDQQNALQETKVPRTAERPEISAIVASMRPLLEKRGLPIDAAKFEKTLLERVSTVLDDQKIPQAAKTRFLADLSVRMERTVETLTPEMVSRLRNARKRESLGAELPEPDEFYARLILDQNVENYVAESSAGLREAFSAEKVEFSGRTYGKAGFDRLLSELSRIDAVSGIDSHTLLSQSGSDLSNPSSAFEILAAAAARLSPEYGANLRRFIMQSGLPESGWYRKLSFKSSRGEDLAITETVNAYAAALGRFRKREGELRSAKNAANGAEFVAGTKALVGMDRLETGFETIAPDRFAKKLETAPLSDIVIALRRVAEVVPIVWDASGGAFDIVRAIDGIETDGRRLDGIERSFTGAFGALWITVWFGWARRAYRGGKLAKELSVTSKMLALLPAKIDEHRERGWKLPAVAENFLSRLLPTEKAGVKMGLIEARVESGALSVTRVDLSDPRKAETDLFKALSNPEVREIRFGRTLATEERRFLWNLVAKNHPMLEIDRLVAGNTVANVSFSGIKQLNDRFGQALVDKLLHSAKREIRSNFDRTVLDAAENGRVVRDEYKHLTFSLPSWTDAKSALFGDMAHRSELVERAIAENAAAIREVSTRLSKETGKPVSVEDVVKTIRKEFDFSIGTSTVPARAGTAERLEAFREAELASRKTASDRGVEVGKFGPEDTLRIAREAVSMENGILQKWGRSEFSQDGIQYPVVVRLRGETRISPELLWAVRKNGAGAIVPKELGQAVEDYIATLNSGFDFLSPLRGSKESAEASRAIESSIQSGRLSKKAFENTFKGFRSKESLAVATNGLSGIRVSIDVKGMGVENIESFRQIAHAVSRSGNGSDPATLTAGKAMTERFSGAVADMKKRYPDAEIAIWGDEILIFVPEKAGISSERLVSDVSDALLSRSLEGRVAYSDAGKSSDAFQALDASMGTHKAVEKLFSKEVHRHALNPTVIPKSVTVHGVPPVWFDPEKALRRAISALSKAGYGTESFETAAGMPKWTAALSKFRFELRFPIQP